LIFFCLEKTPRKLFVQTGHVLPDGRVWAIGGLKVKHAAAESAEKELVAPAENKVDDVNNIAWVADVEAAMKLKM
jgi:predicted S18 family serine protease